MDVYCQRCGEPCDVFHLHHDMEPEFRRMFKAGKGCDCCEGKGKPIDSKRTQAMSILMDLMPDDIDGVAASMDDFDYMGLLED